MLKLNNLQRLSSTKIQFNCIMYNPKWENQMNNNSEIKRLLEKFLLNQCNSKEMAIIIAYFQDEKATNELPTVEEVQLLLEAMPKMESSKAESIFATIIESEDKKVLPISKRYTKQLAIAASIVLMVSIGWTFRTSLFNPIQQKNTVVDPNEITLQLEDGTVQVIKTEKTEVVKNANGHVIANHENDKMVYDAKAGLEKLVYNTIKIPYGKRFELQLSDGTKVHLNAGTTLKYPVNFIRTGNRQVFLEGEAYFDVAKDKSRPFIVNADKINVRVLGTHFNVSNYPEDEKTDVVLVEGSVGMYPANESFSERNHTLLKPGFKGSFDKSNDKIKTIPVLTDEYTYWMSGGLFFREMTFRNIMMKLERHYNKKIVTTNTKIMNERFNASFKDEPIEKILSYFNEIHKINYTITKEQIIIK